MNNYNEYLLRNMNKNENKYIIEQEPYTAFIKGNSFKNLYKGYKNYKPMDINPTNEKQYSLLLVQMYDFISHDLGLYLDVNPNDEKVLNLRNKYMMMQRKALMDYENKYGSLNLNSTNLNNTPWGWDKTNFPWEVEN